MIIPGYVLSPGLGDLNYTIFALGVLRGQLPVWVCRAGRLPVAPHGWADGDGSGRDDLDQRTGATPFICVLDDSPSRNCKGPRYLEGQPRCSVNLLSANPGRNLIQLIATRASRLA